MTTPYDIIHWRLRQAKQALADNRARAKLPQAQRRAAIQVELELGRICARQRFLAQVRAIWRGAEDRIERGESGL